MRKSKFVADFVVEFHEEIVARVLRGDKKPSSMLFEKLARIELRSVPPEIDTLKEDAPLLYYHGRSQQRVTGQYPPGLVDGEGNVTDADRHHRRTHPDFIGGLNNTFTSFKGFLNLGRFSRTSKSATTC